MNVLANKETDHKKFEVILWIKRNKTKTNDLF